jgi:nonribosomal peptide synthetase protein BlmX
LLVVEQESPEFAVSPRQRALWSQRATGDAVDAVQVCVRLDGGLERGQMDAALGVVVGEHESLRTSFVDMGDAGPCRRGLR